MRLTSSIESGCTCPVLPSISHLNPSTKPRTSEPPSRLRMVTAPITLLIPGAGPPPTSMPTMGRDALMVLPLYVFFKRDGSAAWHRGCGENYQDSRLAARGTCIGPRRLKSIRHLLTIPEHTKRQLIR